MSVLGAIKNSLDRILNVVCVALFVLLVVVVTWQVFARQVLHAPSAWTETLSRYLFIWLGLLGAALVFSERGHIAIDLLIRKLAPGMQKALALVIEAIVIVFAALIMVYGGWRASMLAWQQNLTGLPTTIGPWYLALPLAGVLVMFYSVYHALRVVKGLEEPVPPDDDITESI